MTLDLPAAYQILGLPQGAARELVQSRYKHLVRMHHPDRFTNQQDKIAAEETLKKINAARELIEKFFDERAIKNELSNNDHRAKEKAPEPPPEPGPWWQTVYEAIKAESAEPLKKYEKKNSFEERLADYVAPLKFTRDTKQRRLWIAVIVLLLFEACFMATVFDRANAKNNKAPTVSECEQLPRASVRVEPGASTSNDTAAFMESRPSTLSNQKARQREYFLKLAIDRCNVAIRQDELMINQIAVKLLSEDIALENRRQLSDLSEFHKTDKQRQLAQKEVLLAQLVE